MNISVALDGTKKRDLQFFAGDDMSIVLTVYAHDGDVTPITVTNVRFAAAGGSLPLDTEFTVPSNYIGRAAYRIIGDVDGITTTLVYGVLQTACGWPLLCCGPFPGPYAWGVVGKAENITVRDDGHYFAAPTNVEDALQSLAGTFGGEAAAAAAQSAAAANEDAQQTALDRIATGQDRDASAASASTASGAAGTATAAAGVALGAQSAALIQAGVYVTKEAGLADAAVLNGQAFKYQGDGTTTAAMEARKVLSPNLFNASTIRAGYAINSATGGILAFAGAGVSAFIPVTPGQQYILSGTRGANGVSFFASASDTAQISGSYQTGNGPFTAPAGAAFVVIDLYRAATPNIDKVQFEPGTVANTYSAYGTVTAIPLPGGGYPSAVFVQAQADRLDQTTTSTPSPNLFNAAAIRLGYGINSGSGHIQAFAGWGVSPFIAVTPGQSYTLSGTRGRIGLAFYSSASDTAYVANSYDNRTTMPITVVAPPGSAYVAFNVFQASNTAYDKVQFQPGATSTDYGAFGTIITRVDKTKISPGIIEAGPQTALSALVLSQTGTSSIAVPLGASVLKLLLAPFKANTHYQSYVWNFGGDQIDGAAFRPADDDVAPYRVFGTTIGANHGFSWTKSTMVAHGKTQVDVGSVWSSGGVQWVLAAILDADNLYVTARTSNNVYAGGTLTHVSGATHTANIVTSAVLAAQWYQPIKNRAFSISVDGAVITNYDTTYPYSRNVTFSESYEIMNKSSIVEWLITQVGTATDISIYTGGTSDLSVSMSYVFDTLGGCTLYKDFLALNNVPNFQDIMFTQAQAMYGNALTGMGPFSYYVPKTLPLTFNSTNYDFTKIVDMTSWVATPPASRLNFTPSVCEPTGQLADRALMLNNKIGIAFGYLPVRDADPSVRRTNAANKALQISEIAKLYLSCIDTPTKTSLAAGDYYSAVCYRNWFLRGTARTAVYFPRSVEGDYLYADWHITTTDRIQLPPHLQGRAFTVVEKSSNVTVLSLKSASSIVFGVAAAGSYGYAVLKFA